MTKRLTQATAPLSTEVKLSLRTTPDTKVTGFRAKMSGKERESKSGLMAPCTRVGGKQTKPTARVDSFMPMEMSTMDSGSTIRLTDSACTAISTEPSMKGTGKKISNTEMESRPGPMVPSTKGNTSRERNMEQAASHGLTAALTTVSSLKITSREKASTTGPTAESIMDYG